MPRSAYINSWIVGMLLSTAVLFAQETAAQGSAAADQEAQVVVPRPEARRDAEIVEDFERRLQQYDGVRRRLDQSLPTVAMSDKPDAIRTVVKAHSHALRTARYGARQGDLLGPDLADLFRRLIREFLDGVTARDFLATITEDDALLMDPPGINASYPEGAALTTMPPDLLKLFPALPAELEYRFMGRYLILWDRHANLIVDFIRNALPPWTRSERLQELERHCEWGQSMHTQKSTSSHRAASGQ